MAVDGPNSGGLPVLKTPQRLVAGLAALTALTAVLFVLAPVHQDVVTYSWPEQGIASDAKLPLFPYVPDRLDVWGDCASLHKLSTGSTLSTAPMDNVRLDQPVAEALAVNVRGRTADVRIGGRRVLSAPVDRDCDWHIRSDATGTTVDFTGTRAHTPARPMVLGFFTDLPADTSGVSATVVADTQYETSPSPLKVASGATSALAFAIMLGVLARSGARRLRLLPRRWWRPRAADAVVTGGLGTWVLLGPLTVDDGYIVTMLKSGSDTGFIGNYFRWFNAPEAPFGWFYEPYRLLSEIGAAIPLLRLPSAVIGLACWLLVDRLVLPRVLSRPGGAARWTAAGGFLLWYLAFDVGLRPEPLVVLGMLGVWVLTERATATRSPAPLGAAVAVAVATVAVTPTGLAAVLPLVVAVPSLLRGFRRGGFPVVLTLAVVVAAGATGVLWMLYDQTATAALDATRVRTEIGPSHPPSAEPRRYERLLHPGMVEGALARRMPVLLTGFALAVTLLLVALRRAPGVAGGPTLRLVGATALFPLVLAVTPTKWTHHFGALAGFGCVVLAVFAHTLARGALRAWSSRAAAAGGFTVAFAAGMAGPNSWWSASSYGMRWNGMAPHLGSTPVWHLVAVAGGALTVGMAVVALLRAGWATPQPSARILAGCFATVLWLVVLFEAITVADAVRTRWDTYSLGKSNLQAVADADCGVEDDLDVEPDRSRGVLDQAGDWFVLPPGIAAGRTPPLTIPAASEGAATVRVEFGRHHGSRVLPVRSKLMGVATRGEWRDLRLDPAVLAPSADRVRVRVEPGGSAGEVGPPRLPVVVPLRDLVPAGERVALDWPNAFLLPCRRPASLDDGTVQPVRYRFAAGGGSRRLASGEVSAGNGGPYAPLYGLATAHDLPTYLRGDSIREPVTLVRFDYVAPATLTPAGHHWRLTAGW